MSLCAQVEGSTTCTINKATPVTVPMDEKFLPDSVKGGSVPNPIPYDMMPEGYPRKGMKEFTVETEGSYTYLGDDFPNFDEGDTVTVTVDGVEHSLVAFWDDDQDGAAIGDASDVLAAGTGLGWQICWGGF